MNDPGFDRPIQEDARIVENQREEDEMDEVEEDEQSFLAPRYVILRSSMSTICSPRDERAARPKPFHLLAPYDEGIQRHTI
jgi:hypothetical protein